MGFSFFDLLFPKHCAGCGKFGNYICQKCRTSQPLHFPQICPVCERPAVDGRTHSGCKTPLALDGATFVFRYSPREQGSARRAGSYKPPISVLLKELKYKFGRELKDVIVSWTIEGFRKQDSFFKNKPVLVPVPLHPLRENWRGFNQAEILGREIAYKMGWEYSTKILVRTKFRKPQTEVKKAEQRFSNVRGIFTINQPLNHITSQQFILFDDIWTTGATMKEAAKVLKRRGAKFVWALAVAR